MSRNNTGNPIGSKAFADFEDNVPNLDVAVNGSESEWVDRLGRPRKTLMEMEREFDADQQWREENFNAMQSGELTNRAETAADRAETARDAAFINADVYPDVAAGRAAVANGEQFQVVEGDEIVRYRRINTSTQAEVARYPAADAVSGLKSRADTLESTVGHAEPLIERADASLDGGPDLEIAADSDGHLYRRVDEEGMYYVPHLVEPIQDAINRASGGLSGSHPGDDISQVWDGRDRIVERTDARGAKYISPGKGHIQHHLRQSLVSEPGLFTGTLKQARDWYPDSVKDAVASLQQQCLPYVEPPPLLVPNNYHVPNSILTAFTLSDDNPVVQLPFPNTDGGSVHPYILPMRVPFLGYKWLLTDSCHKNGTSAEETPVMFGTNDLENFDLIPDVPNPMTHSAPGGASNAYGSYNSDPFFTYDPSDGALIWGARSTSSSSTWITTKTYDGVNWSERVEQPSAGGSLSPSFLYDLQGGGWHLWSASEGVLRHFTGPTVTGPWEMQSERNFQSAHGIRIWHFEVKYLGDRFAIVCHSRQEDSQVYLGLSDNGDDWVMSPGLVQPQSPNIYKPTFFPEFRNENEIRLTFMWSHWNWVNQSATGPDAMQLYIQRSNWIDLTSL